MVASTQPRDKLEDQGSQDDEVPITVWKEYETKGKKGRKKVKKVVTLEEEKIMRWAVGDKKD